MIKIELTQKDADKFVAFQKHYDLFTTMELTGAFDVQYGKVILNYAGGIIQNIVIEQVAWKRNSVR